MCPSIRAGFPRIAVLGVFPTREGVIASLGMIVLLAIGFAYNRRKMKRNSQLAP